jgi:hypothetical protein
MGGVARVQVVILAQMAYLSPIGSAVIFRPASNYASKIVPQIHKILINGSYTIQQSRRTACVLVRLLEANWHKVLHKV